MASSNNRPSVLSLLEFCRFTHSEMCARSHYSSPILQTNGIGWTNIEKDKARAKVINCGRWENLHCGYEGTKNHNCNEWECGMTYSLWDRQLERWEILHVWLMMVGITNHQALGFRLLLHIHTPHDGWLCLALPHPHQILEHGTTVQGADICVTHYEQHG